MNLTENSLVEWANFQAAQQHTNNRKWWVNLETGEPLDRNKGEMIALIHSEISEAWQGLLQYDGKLHAYNGAQVEIIDALIRIFDFMGGFGITLSEPEADYSMVCSESFDPISFMFNECHSATSELLELYRKNPDQHLIQVGFHKLIQYLVQLFDEITIAIDDNDIVEFESQEPFPLHTLDEVLEAKAQFNLNRADHSLEHRKSEGGKKF